MSARDLIDKVLEGRPVTQILDDLEEAAPSGRKGTSNDALEYPPTKASTPTWVWELTFCNVLWFESQKLATCETDDGAHLEFQKPVTTKQAAAALAQGVKYNIDDSLKASQGDANLIRGMTWKIVAGIKGWKVF